MAIRTILHYPDPRLRQKAQPVGDITPEITKLIDDMAETMYAAPGVGLAATQIGEPHRVFLVDIAADDEPSNLLVFINPEIVRQEGQLTGPEGVPLVPWHQRGHQASRARHASAPAGATGRRSRSRPTACSPWPSSTSSITSTAC